MSKFLISTAYIRPEWSAPPHIKAFSTTRVNGFSRGVYHAMNLAEHVGDNLQVVARNRHKLASDLNLPTTPVWLEQVHSTLVVNADTPIISAADGATSCSPNTVCAVLTADCLPLLLSNLAGDQVAAIHVGWRGLANGIIENAIASFNCDPGDIMAWAGPCIGPTKFEIDIDVRDKLGGPDSAYKMIKNNKLLANLYLLCEQRLSGLGVNDYSFYHGCTYTDESRFFSYRRDGQCGRMASLIWIERS